MRNLGVSLCDKKIKNPHSSSLSTKENSESLHNFCFFTVLNQGDDWEILEAHNQFHFVVVFVAKYGKPLVGLVPKRGLGEGDKRRFDAA